MEYYKTLFAIDFSLSKNAVVMRLKDLNLCDALILLYDLCEIISIVLHRKSILTET
jgi:hypothetical protein